MEFITRLAPAVGDVGLEIPFRVVVGHIIVHGGKDEMTAELVGEQRVETEVFPADV